jgi:FlaA1/EpsC-like NDP-sugar epimerase
VVELAEDLVRLMGLEPHRDIAIEFTGVRPGEKINEELFYASEEVTATSHPKILRAKATKVLDVKSEAFIAELVRCTTAKELLNLVCVYEGNGREERSEQELAAFPPQAGEYLGAAN